MMSAVNLMSQIREEHLTCSICCEEFKTPKALPCLHTFCEGCLRDYVIGRGYESAGNFPCPVCRRITDIPSAGVAGFPTNHLMSSLSDTVQPPQQRPVPKPRKSLGVGQTNSSTSNQLNQLAESEQYDKPPPKPKRLDEKSKYMAQTPGQPFVCGGDRPNLNSSSLNAPPPPYSSVSAVDTNPKWDSSSHGAMAMQTEPYFSNKSKLCSNDEDPNFITVPKNEFSIVPGTSPTLADFNLVVSQPSQTAQPSSNGGVSINSKSAPSQIGWNLNTLDPAPPPPDQRFNQHNDRPASGERSRVPPPRPPPPVLPQQPMYPVVPQGFDSVSTMCAENLMLRFGKQGPNARDFVKPIGLTISKMGHYIVSDNGGEQSRIFIYSSGGELTAAFKTGYKVEDISITKNDEIFAAVKSNTCAFRQFSLAGQLKAEHGKFFAYESPCGISALHSGGVVLSGPENNCIYVLTNQMKLATKFGRKGKGDGYFLSPANIAVNSKDHIIVTDKVNNNVQVFYTDGKFKLRFNAKKSEQLNQPLGVCVDNKNNIIVADSGNFSVDVFSSVGTWLSSVVTNTHQLGEQVRPVNVAFTPTGKVAVLLKGPYFAEVRVYTSNHQQIQQAEPVSHSAWY